MNATLIAVQLDITADVLASAEAYWRALDAVAAAAVDAAGDDRGPTLVVFPEGAGHLALYALAPARARRAKSLAGVLGTAALRRPLDVLRGLATANVLDPRHAVVAALAPEAEWKWRGVFGRMARRHGAWVVAGSHLRLAASGELANASMVFDPDGKLVATTEKVNPVPGLEDGSRGALKLARGSASRLPIVDASGFGKLATLIGYDACIGPVSADERWEPVAERLAARGGVDVVANPVASARIPLAHLETAGLAASLAATRAARFGVIARLAGGVLDLTFGGASEILACTGGTVNSVARAGEGVRGCSVHARVAID